ncbi:aromatic amino acid exporter YddG [Oceanibium sediminis]|uniref:aromatic amino acid exporter YddG n=1 Tax=Oceanibium sediminis TaxID=2026339 RepID=UPI000DD3CD0E|nr:EamA family transporter [Oceanibium sediminis]
MTTARATLIGFGAVLLWALLALFTAASGAVPPFLLAALSFGIGGASGAVAMVLRGDSWAVFRQPLPVWALGIFGLFGYHFAYFTALRNAPPVEAGLIAYLWPLLIVLFSAAAGGGRLRAHHLMGALMGFAGAGLIVSRGGSFEFEAQYSFGYLVAFGAAFLWSGYSVLSGRFKGVPTAIVTGYCLVTAALATLCHLAFEQTIWPADTVEWAAVIGLGLGPVGLAFFIWDIGMKHGDMRVLGAASYAAPLLSTLVLIAAGEARFTATIAIACVLITLGAVLAAKDMIRRGRPLP